MTVAFIDSNVLLQCRSLEELPWDEVCDDDLLLLIPRPVQEQIDRLKQDGNSRRAKRARKASSLLRKLLLVEGEEMNMHFKKRRSPVRLGLAPSLQPRNPEGTLNFNSQDDRIIGEILAYIETRRERPLLISHDTNILLTAKRSGVKFFAIPDEWLLQPEPDLRDKKISGLMEELRQYKESSPSLSVEVIPSDRVSVQVEEYEPLAVERVKELREIVAERLPMNRNFGRQTPFTLVSGYQPPSEHAIRTYEEEKYPQWLDAVEKFFETVHISLGLHSRCFDLTFRLMNDGFCPAENLLVEIKALGNLELLREDIQQPRFPEPPDPPARQPLFSPPTLHHNESLYRTPVLSPNPQRRDRFSFYWRDEESSYHSFECQEFRHKREPEDFHVQLMTFQGDRGIAEFNVSAANVGSPLTKRATIEVSRSHCTTEDKIDELLQRLERQR